MNLRLKHFLFWTLAVLITISAAIYQKTTGPTYPVKIKVQIAGENFKLKLMRSQEIGTPCYVDLNIPDSTITATIFYKRYKVKEVWNQGAFQTRITDGKHVLSALLPEQPEAGKIAYYILLKKGNEEKWIRKEQAIVIRFKGAVPLWVLLPHILFMFSAMLLATITAIFVFDKDYANTKKYGILTFYALLIGGMILGPMVQKYAFSEFWTGIPWGWDLTDNKTLIAFVAWLIAFFLNKKKENPIAFLIATIVLYAIYTIPHSAFGSELNYESGKVVQGMISLLLR